MLSETENIQEKKAAIEEKYSILLLFWLIPLPENKELSEHFEISKKNKKKCDPQVLKFDSICEIEKNKEIST